MDFGKCIQELVNPFYTDRQPGDFTTGMPWTEAAAFGNLLGTKIDVNELVGYLELVKSGSTGSGPRYFPGAVLSAD